MAEPGKRTLHLFDQCRLAFSGPSNLSKVANLQDSSTSLFGRKINAVDLVLPAGTQGLFHTSTGDVKQFDSIRYWRPDVQPGDMDQIPQLLRYHSYISRMHAA